MKIWLQELLDAGLVPYLATTEKYLDYFDLSLFEGHEIIRVLEREDHRNFHEAYLVSNSLAFGNPDLKMQNWVYIDCVLMQTAVVGFAIPVNLAPNSMLDFYEKDPWIDVSKLDYIPVSGQIASLGVDKKRFIGFSLFSLRRQMGDMSISKLAQKTKYAGLSVIRAQEAESFIGISQYNNTALMIHTRFGEKMYIEQTTAPMHPLRDMSFTYKMKINFNEERIFGELGEETNDYDFLLKSDDLKKKLEIQTRINSGEKFYICDPVHIQKDDGLYLPIKIDKD